MNDHDPGRLSPDDMHRIVRARFAAAGVALARDVTVAAEGIEVQLDGYDASRRLGYIYVPSGAHPLASARGLDCKEVGNKRPLSDPLSHFTAAGGHRVLQVWQDDIPNRDVLERHIDAFFNALRQ
ncbi:MAG: hypothetical protein AAGC55_18335 [Myxococcota bacterium]